MVDGERIPFDQILGDPKEPNIPRETAPGDKTASRMVRGLGFTVTPPAAFTSWDNEGSHTLTIENLDGQKAECEFKIIKIPALDYASWNLELRWV